MKKLMMILLVVAIPAAGLFAQRGQAYGMRNGAGQGQGMYCQNTLNLTAEQQEQIQNMRLEHLKVIQPKHDRLAVLRLEYNTAISAGDKAAINKIIDEQTNISSELKKERADHQLAVSAVLTDDQKVLMDARNNSFGNKGNRVNGRRGMGPRYCQSPGIGR